MPSAFQPYQNPSGWWGEGAKGRWAHLQSSPKPPPPIPYILLVAQASSLCLPDWEESSAPQYYPSRLLARAVALRESLVAQAFQPVLLFIMQSQPDRFLLGIGAGHPMPATGRDQHVIPRLEQQRLLLPLK